jgi:hypothetical protein
VQRGVLFRGWAWEIRPRPLGPALHVLRLHGVQRAARAPQLRFELGDPSQRLRERALQRVGGRRLRLFRGRAGGQDLILA